MKQAILKRYNTNEETYQQRFRNTRRKTDESYVETKIRLKLLKPTEPTKQDLVDVTIRKQLVNAMPKELQLGDSMSNHHRVVTHQFGFG